MKLLLVDDEPPALAKLRRLLAAIDGVQIVGEAGDGASALALAAERPADAVLLDIQMPAISGLEVATRLPPGLRVVFVTAFDAHAVRAFELNAVDYLLKPYTGERLRAAIDRLRERLTTAHDAPADGDAAVDDGAVAALGPTPRHNLAQALHSLQPVPGHWLVHHRGGLVHVPLAGIECVEAADNYIELHGAARSHLDRMTLAAFLAHPAAAGFVQVHRSCAVQLEHVRGVMPLAKGDADLTLASGRHVRVSRRYRQALFGAAAGTGG